MGEKGDGKCEIEIKRQGGYSEKIYNMSNLSSEEHNREDVKEALSRDNFSLESASSKNSN